MDRQNETAFGENSYIWDLGMKKLVLILVICFLTGIDGLVVTFVRSDCKQLISLLLGTSEENSEDETKTFSEEVDDEIVITHRWMSKDKSHDSSLHFLYQDVIFHSLELEVVVPPPKA